MNTSKKGKRNTKIFRKVEFISGLKEKGFMRSTRFSQRATAITQETGNNYAQPNDEEPSNSLL